MGDGNDGGCKRKLSSREEVENGADSSSDSENGGGGGLRAIVSQRRPSNLVRGAGVRPLKQQRAVWKPNSVEAESVQWNPISHTFPNKLCMQMLVANRFAKLTK